jgi:glucose-1-phosphate cytidylyltransferase
MPAAPTVRDLPVVILCGGMGTRLREETEHRPKPMVEVGEQPILWHIMKIYGAAGSRRFVLCLGYKGWEIKQYFLRYHEKRRDFTLGLDGTRSPRFHDLDGDHENWEVTLAETGLETATGARLKRVTRYLDADTFFLTYGDAVADLDMEQLLRFHRAHGGIATVTGVRPTSRYGEMTVEGERVVEFHEKPRDGKGLVSGGFFVFERRFLDYLDTDPQLFFELEPLQRLAREGELHAYVHEGAWYSMDTYRDYLQLNRIWNEGSPPWKIWK